MKVSLQDVAATTGGTIDPPDGSITVVDGASIDSRTAVVGNLFVPLVAERDGHDFVAKALAAGATAFLTSLDPDDLNLDVGYRSVPRIRVADTARALTDLGRLARSRLEGPVIGITGSVGKTSVKDLARAACSGPTSRPVWASARSFNNELGVPLTLFNAPDDAGTVIVEMGARGIGHIRKLCAVARPTIGVVTTVAMAHSELFGSIEAVAQGKGELVEALPGDGVAVLNADNPLVRAMARRTEARVLTFGLAADADVRVDDVTLNRLLHPTFQLSYEGRTQSVTVPVAGAHMAHNAAAAVSAALASGVPFEQAVAQVAGVALSPWRMEVAAAPSGAVIINDAYNANPTSMRAALAALVETAADQKVAVIGEMAELGEEGPAEHHSISREAAAAGVRVIAVASPAYGPAVEHVDDIDAALAALGPLDGNVAVLVKGSRVAGLERLATLLLEPGS